MDKSLFGFLKDRKIFTSGGHKTLREYLTDQEVKSEHRLRERTVVRKRKHKGIKKTNTK
jgi:hypothetical protein